MVREVVKDEFVMETNSFNMNAQMTADEDGDVSYEEAGQQKNLIISKSQSSISNSNEQVYLLYVYSSTYYFDFNTL